MSLSPSSKSCSQRAVTRQNGGNCTAAAARRSLLGSAGENRVLEIFKLTLFPASKELRFENKQNKMKQKSVWLLGVGFGFLVHVRMNLSTCKKDPRGTDERGGRDVSAKTVLDPGRCGHPRPLLPGNAKNNPHLRKHLSGSLHAPPWPNDL